MEVMAQDFGYSVDTPNRTQASDIGSGDPGCRGVSCPLLHSLQKRPVGAPPESAAVFECLCLRIDCLEVLFSRAEGTGRHDPELVTVTVESPKQSERHLFHSAEIAALDEFEYGRSHGGKLEIKRKKDERTADYMDEAERRWRSNTQNKGKDPEPKTPRVLRIQWLKIRTKSRVLGSGFLNRRLRGIRGIGERVRAKDPEPKTPRVLRIQWLKIRIEREPRITEFNLRVADWERTGKGWCSGRLRFLERFRISAVGRR